MKKLSLIILVVLFKLTAFSQNDAALINKIKSIKCIDSLPPVSGILKYDVNVFQITSKYDEIRDKYYKVWKVVGKIKKGETITVYKGFTSRIDEGQVVNADEFNKSKERSDCNVVLISEQLNDSSKFLNERAFSNSLTNSDIFNEWYDRRRIIIERAKYLKEQAELPK